VEERLRANALDLVRLQRWQARSAIADRHHTVLDFRALRRACEFEIPVYVRHRIQAIDYKIHEDLLQLDANLP
jgi:hypothetical protein